MSSDACETAETVADVLLSLDEAPDEVGKMLRCVSGDMDDPDDMTWEDWIRPLKLTGGRVCLRFDWEGVTWYVSRAGSGRLMAADERHDPHPAAATSEALADPRVDVTPVLREDTPLPETPRGGVRGMTEQDAKDLYRPYGDRCTVHTCDKEATRRVEWGDGLLRAEFCDDHADSKLRADSATEVSRCD